MRCLKRVNVLEQVLRLRVLCLTTRAQQLRQGILLKRDGQMAELLPVERYEAMIGERGFLGRGQATW